MGGIVALVLTYNRKELLSRGLAAIASQSRPPDAVIVLDNGSTDGTEDYLCTSGLLRDERVSAYRIDDNVGPAAGFDILFRLAYRRGFEWLWCMDDDVIPGPTALAELMSAFAANFSRPNEVGFLVSTALDGDGKPSNVPEIDLRAERLRCPNWADHLDHGIARVRWATFNSILFPRSTLDRFGGLCPDFYFAGEDIDFTMRITEEVPGYFVGKSKVAHLSSSGGVFSVLTQSDPVRIRMGTYFYRNTMYIRRRYYSRASMAMFVGRCCWEALLALKARSHRMSRAAHILAGLAMGLWFMPRRPPPLDAPAPVPVINLRTMARCLYSEAGAEAEASGAETVP